MSHESETGVGHNVGADQLKSYIDRIERLLEEQGELRKDIKDVKAEAKSNGFDPQTIMSIVRIRAMDKAKRQEQESLLETYMSALGMI